MTLICPPNWETLVTGPTVPIFLLINMMMNIAGLGSLWTECLCPPQIHMLMLSSLM